MIQINDGLCGILEDYYGTNPDLFDSDDDGLWDNYELKNGLDPCDDGTDVWGWDGASWIIIGAGEGNIDNGIAGDPDTDGLVNLYESWANSDPQESDTDGDTIDDCEEYYPGVDGYETDPTKMDTDEDDIDDNVEINVYNSHPNDPDTDNDGLLDGEEVTHGTNLLNPDHDGDHYTDGEEQ
jgi:hypothetical protein